MGYADRQELLETTGQGRAQISGDRVGGEDACRFPLAALRAAEGTKGAGLGTDAAAMEAESSQTPSVDDCAGYQVPMPPSQDDSFDSGISTAAEGATMQVVLSKQGRQKVVRAPRSASVGDLIDEFAGAGWEIRSPESGETLSRQC